MNTHTQQQKLNTFFTKIVLTTCFIVALFAPTIALAAIHIDEIMFDPPGGDTNHEWIEIQNDSDESIDIAGWKLLESNANHALVPVESSTSGGTIVAAHGFAIIADNAATFSADWPDFSGLLFDSSFSLSNSGETLSLKDGTGAVVDEATYTGTIGATGDGNSLQGQGTIWVTAVASPGKALSTTHNTTSDGDESAGSGSDSTSTGEASDTNKKNENKTEQLPAKKKTTASISFTPSIILYDSATLLTPVITSPNGEKANHGYVVWNFGDGEMYKSQNTDAVPHTFSYPGRYVVNINYYDWYYDSVPSATAKAVISAASPNIEWSDDGYAFSLKNAGKADIDISKWQIADGNSREVLFSFPENTTLLAGSLLILEKQKLHIKDVNAYVLQYPNGLHVPLHIPIDAIADGDTKEIEDVGIPNSIPNTIVSTNDSNATNTINNHDITEAAPLEPVGIDPVQVEINTNDAPQFPMDIPKDPLIDPVVPQKNSKISWKILLLLAGIIGLGIVVSLLKPTSLAERGEEL